MKRLLKTVPAAAMLLAVVAIVQAGRTAAQTGRNRTPKSPGAC